MNHLQFTIQICKMLYISEKVNLVRELELTGEHFHFKICM